MSQETGATTLRTVGCFTAGDSSSRGAEADESGGEAKWWETRGFPAGAETQGSGPGMETRGFPAGAEAQGSGPSMGQEGSLGSEEVECTCRCLGRGDGDRECDPDSSSKWESRQTRRCSQESVEATKEPKEA